MQDKLLTKKRGKFLLVWEFFQCYYHLDFFFFFFLQE